MSEKPEPPSATLAVLAHQRGKQRTSWCRPLGAVSMGRMQKLECGADHREKGRWVGTGSCLAPEWCPCALGCSSVFLPHWPPAVSGSRQPPEQIPAPTALFSN